MDAMGAKVEGLSIYVPELFDFSASLFRTLICDCAGTHVCSLEKVKHTASHRVTAWYPLGTFVKNFDAPCPAFKDLMLHGSVTCQALNLSLDFSSLLTKDSVSYTILSLDDANFIGTTVLNVVVAPLWIAIPYPLTPNVKLN